MRMKPGLALVLAILTIGQLQFNDTSSLVGMAVGLMKNLIVLPKAEAAVVTPSIPASEEKSENGNVPDQETVMQPFQTLQEKLVFVKSAFQEAQTAFNSKDEELRATFAKLKETRDGLQSRLAQTVSGKTAQHEELTRQLNEVRRKASSEEEQQLLKIETSKRQLAEEKAKLPGLTNEKTRLNSEIVALKAVNGRLTGLMEAAKGQTQALNVEIRSLEAARKAKSAMVAAGQKLLAVKELENEILRKGLDNSRAMTSQLLEKTSSSISTDKLAQLKQELTAEHDQLITNMAQSIESAVSQSVSEEIAANIQNYIKNFDKRFRTIRKKESFNLNDAIKEGKSNFKKKVFNATKKESDKFNLKREGLKQKFESDGVFRPFERVLETIREKVKDDFETEIDSIKAEYRGKLPEDISFEIGSEAKQQILECASNALRNYSAKIVVDPFVLDFSKQVTAAVKSQIIAADKTLRSLVETKITELKGINNGAGILEDYVRKYQMLLSTELTNQADAINALIKSKKDAFKAQIETILSENRQVIQSQCFKDAKSKAMKTAENLQEEFKIQISEKIKTAAKNLTKDKIDDEMKHHVDLAKSKIKSMNSSSESDDESIRRPSVVHIAQTKKQKRTSSAKIPTTKSASTSPKPSKSPKYPSSSDSSSSSPSPSSSASSSFSNSTNVKPKSESPPPKVIQKDEKKQTQPAPMPRKSSPLELMSAADPTGNNGVFELKFY